MTAMPRQVAERQATKEAINVYVGLAMLVMDILAQVSYNTMIKYFMGRVDWLSFLGMQIYAQQGSTTVIGLQTVWRFLEDIGAFARVVSLEMVVSVQVKITSLFLGRMGRDYISGSYVIILFCCCCYFIAIIPSCRSSWQCHPKATCQFFPVGLRCVCNNGYTGDGKFVCNGTNHQSKHYLNHKYVNYLCYF